MQHVPAVEPGSGRPAHIPPFPVVVVALLLVCASFLVQGHIGLNLADEGYLWHGAMRVMRGDIPIRDFQSYDPGRYYWSSFWMGMFGTDGIMGLRISVALFQACGLAAGLLLVSRVVSTRSSFLMVALVLLLWFFPRHKLFDLSLSVFAVYVGSALLDRPTPWRHFAAGGYVGAAAVFGRNHGVYAAMAFTALAVFAWARLDRRMLVTKLLMLGAGILVGYSPMILLALNNPGFFDAVLEGVSLMFRNGATNVPIPVPWPWAVDYGGLPLQWKLHRLFVGLAFVALPVCYGVAGLLVWRERRPEAIARDSIFVSATAVGLVYMHYAFARADAGHLAHSMLPFLLTLFALPPVRNAASGWVRFGVPAAVLGGTLFAAGMMSPLYLHRLATPSSEIVVRGDTLTVDAETARTVVAVQRIVERHVLPGERIVFAPYWPTFYGVLGRPSPLWETYSFGTDSLQERFIRELEERRVEWAVFGNAPLDGRDDRRFSHTHPKIWNYLREHYEPVGAEGLPSEYGLWRRKASAGASTRPNSSGPASVPL